MSAFLCTFLDSCNSIYSSPCHNSSKPFRILTPIHLPHNPLSPIIIRRSKRRKRKNCRDSLQISAVPKSFQLIQTSVHFDGSLIFQFGHPSQILKNDESVEDLVSECGEGSHGVKDVGGDHEKEDITEAIESEEIGESDVTSSDDVSQNVNGVDIGTFVIESAGDVEKDLSESIVESGEDDSVIDDLEGGGEEESNISQVLDVDHEKQTMIEEMSESDELVEDLESEVEEISNDGNVDEDHQKDELDKIEELTISQTSSSTDVSETRVESNEPDQSVEDLEIEGDETSNDVNVDEDLEKHNKSLEIKEATDSDISNSSDASDTSNEVNIEITVSERDNDLTDSQEESNERLVEISQDGEVPLPLSVSISVSVSVSVSLSVSEIETNDFVSSGHGLENADDKEKISDENASLSPYEVEVEVAADSFSLGRIEDSEEGIAVVTKSESPSSKIEPIIEEPNIGVVQLSENKIEAGLQIEVADNEADGDISVVERVRDIVGDLSDSKPEPSEMPLVLLEEVGGPVSDFEVRTNDHFEIVGIMEDDVVNSVISDPINESPLFDLDGLHMSDTIDEEVNLSEDTKDQNIVSELPLSKMIDSGEIDMEEETPLVQGLEAETVLDDGVDHRAFDVFSQADDVESLMLQDQSFSNSLVGAERTEVEEQRNELSEVPFAEAIQLELAEIDVKREIPTTAFLLSSGAAALTHPSKALTGGEDAYFLSCSNWLGVADGISQWSLEGVDRGVYAHELMKNCDIIVSENGSAALVNPIELLSRSVEETQSSGSSTALVAYFDGQALHVVNIGDTGFIIVRHGAVYKKSAPMFHEFNFPVHIQRGDNPSHFLEEYVIDLDEGDAIITATDGLFDNLYEQEIASIVSKSLQASMKPEEIAQVLATRAQEGGKSGSARSPFADAAKAAGYIGFNGGKLDDVAVIVSLVKNRSNSLI